MSNTLTNIDRFNLTTLELFDRLYDSFPHPIDIETKTLGLQAAPDGTSVPESVEFALYAESAVTWLAEEGFVRYEAPQFGATFRRVRLTMRGLTVLGYIPTPLRGAEQSEPLIVKIKKVVKAGAEKAGTEAVKFLVGEAFKLATSAATPNSINTMLQA
jgi:hypothetical protein